MANVHLKPAQSALKTFLQSPEDSNAIKKRKEVIANKLPEFLYSLKHDTFNNWTKKEIVKKLAVTETKNPHDDWNDIKAVHVSLVFVYH